MRTTQTTSPKPTVAPAPSSPSTGPPTRKKRTSVSQNKKPSPSPKINTPTADHTPHSPSREPPTRKKRDPVSQKPKAADRLHSRVRFFRIEVKNWWLSAEMIQNTNPKRKRGQRGRNVCPRLHFGLVYAIPHHFRREPLFARLGAPDQRGCQTPAAPVYKG